jgi:hypothetical protein
MASMSQKRTYMQGAAKRKLKKKEAGERAKKGQTDILSWFKTQDDGQNGSQEEVNNSVNNLLEDSASAVTEGENKEDDMPPADDSVSQNCDELISDDANTGDREK